MHARVRIRVCADLTYCREGYKSLHKKASGWSELVCFLNQHIKAHLRKERKQKKVHDTARAHGREEQNWRDSRGGSLQFPTPHTQVQPF